MKRNIKFLLTFVLALTLLTACSNAPTENAESKTTAAKNEATTIAAETTTEKQTEAKPAVDPDKEIVLAGTRNIAPGEEDAYYCSSILMVWEPLITKDTNGSPIPKLAESYDKNDDATEWTFKLKQGVKFQDGEDFNADAVIANFDRMKLGKRSSSYYSMNIEKTYPTLKEVVRVDDYTVKLTFEKSLPTLDYAMTDFGSAVYSPKCFKEDGSFNGFAIGTGPFKLIENKLDEYAVVERFDDYYGEKAKSKTVKVKVIKDPDTRFSALKSGEIMGVLDLGAIQPVMAMELIKDDNFAISHAPNTITHYIIVNGTKAPFNDVRMRQALSLMIDRQEIVDSFYAGLGNPTSNVLNHMTPFYTELPIEHDVEKAKALAKEVLGDERMPVRFILRSGELARYPNKEEAELMQAQLAELGLDATIEILDSGAWNEAVKTADYNLSLKIKGLSSSEPASLFSSMMKTDSGLNKKWSFGYSNEEVDDLLSKVSSELDPAKRKEIYDRLQIISTEEFPAIPYFNDLTLIAYNKKIAGYEALNYGVTLNTMHWANE